ncbi:L,D-transpeptidase family protein [Cnuella takakiae]|nr:L,D-transpeptidase [Cnuella takakiae]OLY94985.1 hypothetical protein BUE76_20230 [Cnuella takakiae]
MKTAFFTTMLAGVCLFHPAVKENTAASGMAYLKVKSRSLGSAPVNPVRIVIDKSDYELHVYDAKGWFATYPVVFGANPLANKKMEGDKLTPEGVYHIVAKRPHQKWSHFLSLDYPNAQDLARFEALKRSGAIPRNASPGGGIGIHGTWPNDDYMIDRYKNWTNGCISLKNGDVRDLYSFIPVGTPVEIRR